MEAVKDRRHMKGGLYRHRVVRMDVGTARGRFGKKVVRI